MSATINVLIPLHPSQYKSIQNMSKGRDVRSEIPVEETEEYKALRDNYAVIYEYMVNKGNAKDGDSLTFEARKSIRDATGTGEMLGTVKEMTTNYLGKKAKILPSEEAVKKASAPLSPPKDSLPFSAPLDSLYIKQLAEFSKKNKNPLEQMKTNKGDYYWYDSFLYTYGAYDGKGGSSGKTTADSGKDYLLVVPAKDPFTGKFDYFMALRTDPYSEYEEMDTGVKFRNARDVYTISEDYSEVNKLRGYLYDFETSSIITISEYYERLMSRREFYREISIKEEEDEKERLKQKAEESSSEEEDEEVSVSVNGTAPAKIINKSPFIVKMKS